MMNYIFVSTEQPEIHAAFISHCLEEEFESEAG